VTFSAGEELCYNLQAQKRAVLIGETTRGGAHPTDSFPLSDTLEITVPTARSINPITGTNWEGVGVKPDVEVPAEEAFLLAYEKALDHIIGTTGSASVKQEAQLTRSGLV
jgi:C-terminal processing protease CtpA/Prc